MDTSGSTQRDRIFRFGPFELSEGEGELRKNGVRVKLQEQPFRVLAELVANAGRIVTREELQQKLWPADTFVDFDVGLNSVIRKLRQALSDDADSARYIETLAKRGYRFIAPVADRATPAQTTSKDSPTVASVSPSGNSTSSATAEESPRKPRRWFWVLAALLTLALLIYGAVAALRRMNTTPPLAMEQRITANPSEAPITGAALSPDGKYLAYSDTTGVYVRHIDTAEVRAIQLPKGFDAVPASWFPDATHLLLSSGQAVQQNTSLWKVSIIGGSPQKLIDNAIGAAVSPDGSKIAFSRGDAGGSVEIWVMGSDGSNLHRIAEANMPDALVRVPARQPYAGLFLSGIAWSPDGRRVAYVRRFDIATLSRFTIRHSLETVDVNGGTRKVLNISTQLLPVIGWAADGRLLYAYRDDPNSEREDSGIWSLRVNQKSGEPEGKAVQLTNGVGQIGGLSVATDGKRLILWRVNNLPQVYLTEIDAETRHFKTPRRLTLDQSVNWATAWTPDSRAILLGSDRSGALQIYRQAIDHAVRELLVEDRGSFLPRLNPDGTQILYAVNMEGTPRSLRLMRVPLQGGSPQVVLQMPNVHNFQCARSPSKLCLIATLGAIAPDGRTVQIFSFDPESGKTQEFAAFKVKENLGWGLSPDGSQFWLRLRDSESRITFMSVSDKSTHEVELKQWPFLNWGDWDADGKSILAISQSANGAPVVLSVEPNGNHRVLLEGDRSMRFGPVIASPDGRYAALNAVTGENNVWMVENF
jgi:Tol biopolymer transport system component/DNA-binding winged helix-turn-helix (wHTH) protein